MSKLSLSLDIASNTNAFLYGTTASLVAGGYIPDLSLDFLNEKYRNEQGNKSRPVLLDHNSATAGNATMTGGYGPELVTNGTFDSNVSGWTVGGGANPTLSFSNGRAVVSATQTGSIVFEQTSTEFEVGKAYEIRVDVARTTDNIDVWNKGASNLSAKSLNTGINLFTYTATQTGYLRIGNLGSVFSSGEGFTIDNISVREVPKIQWRPHNLLKYSEDMTSNKYVDFGSSGNVTFVDPTTITFTGGGPAQVANKTLDTTNLVGQQITGAIELSSQTHAGEKVQIRLNWRGGDGAYAPAYTLTTTPTFVYVTGTVPAGTTGVDLVVSSPSGEQVDKTFTATKWHVYRSDLGGMADVPASERVAGSKTYVRTAGREVTGIELVTDTTQSGTITQSSASEGNPWWSAEGTGQWSISNNDLTRSSGGTWESLRRDIGMRSDAIYRLSFEVSDRTTGSFSIYQNQGTVIKSVSENGSYVLDFVNTSGSYDHILQISSSAFDGTISNISVKEIDVNPASARYLPRIGHHVYNGSQWVNEGLLHESGSRTNIVQRSNAFSTSPWFTFGTSPTITANATTSPSGNDDAFSIDGAGAGSGVVVSQTASASTRYTGSLFVKQGASTAFRLYLRDSDVGADVAYVSASISGGVVSVDSGSVSGNFTSPQTSVSDYGNGWYRVSISAITDTDTTALKLELQNNNPSGSGLLYIYGAQLEAGSTPSSYIPTSGATVTRSAETLTIPAENLPWPEPVSATGNLYNGSDPINLTGSHTFTPTIANDGSTKVVRVKWTQTLNSGARTRMRYRNAADSADVRAIKYYNGDGTFEEIIVTSTGLMWRQVETGIDVDISDVTLEEINPLSVSIAMDGRVTYADTGAQVTSEIFKWQVSGTNKILHYIDTQSTKTGDIAVQQVYSGVYDTVFSGAAYLGAGTYVPFNYAARHGTTFVQGAYDGVSVSADNTPVNFVDLSSTDALIGTIFNGTIRSFRIWANDIADDGIIEASEPELQPTLSLSFDGTESSFIDFEWSE